jgi:hypothetical protein
MVACVREAGAPDQAHLPLPAEKAHVGDPPGGCHPMPTPPLHLNSSGLTPEGASPIP